MIGIRYFHIICCVALAGFFVNATFAGPTPLNGPVVIEEFERPGVLEHWQTQGANTALVAMSIEKNQPGLIGDKSSLKVVFPIDRANWDSWTGITSQVSIRSELAGLSFWVNPQNVGNVTIRLESEDGSSTAEWERHFLKLGEWNRVACLWKDARRTGVYAGTTALPVGSHRLVVGIQKMNAWLSVADGGAWATYHIASIQGLNGPVTVESAVAEQWHDARTAAEPGTYWRGALVQVPILQLVSADAQNRISIDLESQSGKQESWALSLPAEVSARPVVLALLQPLEEGEYTAVIKGKGSVEQQFVVYGANAIEMRMKALEQAIATARKELNVNDATAHAYQLAALAIAERFISLEGPQKLKQGWEAEVGADLQRCVQILERARIGAKNERRNEIRPNDADGIKIDGSHFVSADGKPVMLLGPVGWGEMWSVIQSVAEMGFNVVDDQTASEAGSVRNAMQPPGKWGTPDTFFHPSAVEALLNGWRVVDALKLNLAITFNPSTFYPPDWLYLHYPELKDDGTWNWFYGKNLPPMESPVMHGIWGKYYAGIIPLVSNQPRLLLTWLSNEPQYWSHTPQYLESFREYLRQKYGTIQKLNFAWKAQHANFGAVPFPADKSEKAAWLDWSQFHYGQVTKFFAWQHGEVLKHAPGMRTSNKPIADHIYLQAFARPGFDSAVDFEAEAELYEVPGCDTYITATYRNPSGWLMRHGILLFDFWKSIAPNKPFANLENHYGELNPQAEYALSPEDSRRFVQTLYWQQYLHGVRLNIFWWWRNSMNSGTYRAVTGKPMELYATSEAALDLRRLAKYVALFPGNAEVAIYRSQPSVFLDGAAHHGTLNDVYAGLFFLDAPVGFLTDKMLARGIDPKTKVVVIPEALYCDDEGYNNLLAYVEKGGRVVVIGKESLSRNTSDQPRDTRRLMGHKNVQVAEAGQLPRDYWKLLDAIYTDAGVSRDIRITDKQGNPVWEIECRSVQAEGKTVVYLINMTDNVAAVTISRAGRTGEIYDLLNETPVSSADLTLNPFETRLLEIE